MELTGVSVDIIFAVSCGGNYTELVIIFAKNVQSKQNDAKSGRVMLELLLATMVLLFDS